MSKVILTDRPTTTTTIDKMAFAIKSFKSYVASFINTIRTFGTRQDHKLATFVTVYVNRTSEKELYGYRQ